MPRPPRLHAPGALYHVILRGNHREALFGDTAHDRRALNSIVGDVLAQFDARIHAFCWMTNHLHALLQIADRPLGAIMQRIAMRYSRYRHKALRTTGHLFERRYKAKLVDADAYFLTLLRYIHLNPVQARIASDPADYPWSSHRAYLGTETIHWLTTDLGLSFFSTDLVQARAAYRNFLAHTADIADDPVTQCHPQDSRVLGDDHFLNNLPVVVPFRPRSALTLDQLAHHICEEFQLTTATLRSPSRARCLSTARLQLAQQAVDQRIATVSDVARYLHRDPSTLCKLIQRHRGRRSSS